MATYSLTFTGAGDNAGSPADNALMPVFQIDDTNASDGVQQKDMRSNSQVNALIGGASVKFTIDASRSDPSRNLIYLLRV
jgi:hypothetical protein